MGAPKTAPLREQVISEITAAPGWNKADATALVDALIAEVSAPTPPDALRDAALAGYREGRLEMASEIAEYLADALAVAQRIAQPKEADRG